MARLPQPGGDQGDWGQILNDFLGVSHDAGGFLKGGSVSNGAIQDGAITPSKLNANAPATGNVLCYDGSGFAWKTASSGSIVYDATTTSKGILQLAGDLGGTAAAPTVPGLANKSDVGHGHSIANITNLQSTLDAKVAANEKGAAYGVASLDADGKVPANQLPTSTTVSDATTTSKGILQLAGDLGGTAAAPTVPGLANKSDVSHTHTIANVTNLQAALDSKYTKPSGGIPETDLDAAVQTKLNSTGTGVAKLDDIGDVDVATPSDGQSLVFQAGVWIPATITSSGGVTDHGALTGLGADHHLHYHNDARGDARYYLKADVDTKINGRIDAAEKAAPNGVASLDANGKVPSSQLPPTTSISDATTTSKGILQLAGDLSGTADAPTVPGLAGKVNATEKGAANGVATLGADGKVPAEQLPASSGGGTFTASVKTAAYTCVNYDFLLCNASTSGFTITLPPVGNGVWVRVKKTDSTTNAVIVVGQNNTTINGDASYVLNIQNASQDFMGDGTNWHLI